MSYPNSDDENNISQEKNSEQKTQKEMILKQILSPDARLRLNNIRMVKPDLANLVENYLLNLAKSGFTILILFNISLASGDKICFSIISFCAFSSEFFS